MTQYTLKNKSGANVTLTDWGATILAINVPDKNGKLVDVALGHGTPEAVKLNDCYFGASCGRVANRISGAAFKLGGKTYKLVANTPPLILHGGDIGFSHLLWTAKNVSDSEVTFTLHSPDGDQGFPGAVDVSVTYTWNDQNTLGLTYTATTDAPTIVNLTNHTYFNLNGHDSGETLEHSIQLDSDFYLPINKLVGVTGEVRNVKDSPFDFKTPHKIGERIFGECQQLKHGNGYDHCYILNGEFAARAVGDKTGIAMEVYTDCPSIQFYSGCCLTPHDGKNGAKYDRFSGFCLETQYPPDFINQPAFAKHILLPGQTQIQKTEYRFSA
ncbi:aldose 1-epimerase [Clostridia bacterium]|nr:aldose 1-epimerase [Clostridia bacterium]